MNKSSFSIKRYLHFPLILVAVIFIAASTTSGKFEVSKNLEVLTDIYYELDQNYVSELDHDKMFRAAVDAMLETLDPYTNFISSGDITQYQIRTTGNYAGIGSSISRRDGKLIVTSVMEGAPAQKSGLLPGDVVIEIDGNDATGFSSDKASKMIIGEPGTMVELKVTRLNQDKPVLIPIERDKIEIEAVKHSGMVNDKIGYINLSQFTQNVGRDIGNELKNLKKNHKLEGVILDLRGNPGGLLREAVNVTNVFIPKRKLVTVSKGKSVENIDNYYTLNDPIDKEIPLVVLVDNGSASASEIVSGAIQDYDRGVILGQSTYGKGLVQTHRDLPYKNKLKLTTAKYYIPSGRCIQAIEYFDGNKREVIQDSLRAEFKTVNGRKVYDAKGIDPDIKTQSGKFADVTENLLKSGIIFDFATEYYHKHKTIAQPKDFVLTDTEFENFKSFAIKAGLELSKNVNKNFAALREFANEEGLKDDINSEINALEKAIEGTHFKLMDKNKKEIMRLLVEEIAERYYFASGRLQAGFKLDEDVSKASAILLDKKKYESILK